MARQMEKDREEESRKPGLPPTSWELLDARLDCVGLWIPTWPIRTAPPVPPNVTGLRGG